MYVFICITWVLFRAPSFPIALEILRKMAGLASGGIAFLYSPLLIVLPLVIAAHAIGIMAQRQGAQLRDWFQVRSNRLSGVYVLLRPRFLGAFLMTSWALLVLLFGATGASPFVYFRF